MATPLPPDAFLELFQKNPTPMWVYECLTLRFLAVNAAAEAAYGYTRSEFLARTLADIRAPEDVPAFLREVASRRGLPAVARPFRHRRRDGSLFDVEVTAFDVAFQGRAARAVVAHDVTDAQRAAQELRRQERLLRIVLESLSDGVVVADAQGRIVLFNAAARATSGRSQADDDPAARALELGLLVPETGAPFPLDQLPLMRTLRGESVNDVRVLQRNPARPEGRLLSVSGRPLLGDDGEVTGGVVVVRDETERVRAEAEREDLIKREQRARQIAETLSQANLALGRHVELSAVLETLLEYVGRLIPYDSANVMLLEDGYLVPRALRNYEAWGGDPEKVKQVRFDPQTTAALRATLLGTVRIADTRAFPGWERPPDAAHVISWLGVPLLARGELIGLFSIDKVVPDFFTEEHERLAEALAPAAATAIEIARLVAALRDSAELGRQIVGSAKDGMAVADLDLRLLMWNPVMERLSGQLASAVLGRSVLEAFPFLEGTGGGAVLEKARHGEQVSAPDFKYANPATGQEGWAVANVGPLRDAQGRAIGVLAVFHDVTERRRAEEELRLREERFAMVTKATNDAVWDWDIASDTVWWNEGIETLFGYSGEAGRRPGSWWQERVHPEDLPGVLRDMETVWDKGDPVSAAEYRFRRADGSYTIVLDRGYVIREGGRPVRMIGAMTDVSVRRNLEAQLLQSQKTEAVGRLAGGIAHDFNNLLGVISGYSDLLQRELGTTSRAALRVTEIKKAAERAAALTSQLLAFGRKQHMNPRVLSLNAVVKDLEGMLRRLIGEHIELSTRLAPELWPVTADPGQLGQVLMNLVVNARDALPRGGTVVVETRNASVPDPPPHPELRPGPHVVLTVRDDGMGMDRETRARVFEPFFTTKETGKGTGLGLATVYGIVRQSGGHVTVESAPGAGATFAIWLSAVPGAASDSLVPVRPATGLAAGAGRVLAVEDEPALRELLVEILESAGYEVVAARDGREALDLFEEGRTFDVLVTDMVMPRMSGGDLAAQARKILPGLKVVYMSGYADEARQAGLPKGTALLSKPFTSQALTTRVKEALEEP